MTLCNCLRRRRGATVVECAVIYPAAFLILLGLLIGGLGVFRYQQVAHLAREAARYAAVRGSQYQVETGQAAVSVQDVRDYVVSQSAGLDSSAALLDVEVFLHVTAADGSTTAVAWGASNKAPYQVISDNGQARQNSVSVTVRYQWLPEAFLVGPITLSSTATIPMQY
jgi:Flp pilus assembly protein TadG